MFILLWQRGQGLGQGSGQLSSRKAPGAEWEHRDTQGGVTGFACEQARLMTREGLGGEDSSRPPEPWSRIPRQRGSTAEGGSCQEPLLGEGDFVGPGMSKTRARCPGERGHHVGLGREAKGLARQ